VDPDREGEQDDVLTELFYFEIEVEEVAQVRKDVFILACYRVWYFKSRILKEQPNTGDNSPPQNILFLKIVCGTY